MFKNRFALALALILTLALGGVAMAQTPSVPISGNGITPLLVAGNPSCRGLGYDFGFKPNVDGNEGFIGTYTFDFPGAAGNTVTVASDGTYVNWESTLGIEAVILKGGPNANLYIYLPPALSFGDTGLAAPLNNSQPFGFSHVEFCYTPGDEDFEFLDVSKTAVTSFTREHFWDIAKKVETENEYMHLGYPKVWLYIDGSGDETATWTVDVTYEGYEDSGWNVSGVITVTNTGTLDAVITSIEDVLAGAPIDVDCGVAISEEFPYTLAVDGTLTCSYSEDGYVEGDNVATVTTERDSYSVTEPIVWGDPTTEINETVSVKDISDLFGEVELGMVTAPNNAQFTYDKDFAWADYGRYNCGDFVYDNTATIVETGQSASATLKVNVQCYVGETAWAANGDVPGEIRYNNRGNWATYVVYEYAEKTVTLFAGQTMPAGTVTFSAPVDGKVTITVNLTGEWTFQVASVLAVQDYATAPSGNPAPGQFAWKADATGTTASIVVPANSFYGVHADVEQPDPDFGP